MGCFDKFLPQIHEEIGELFKELDSDEYSWNIYQSYAAGVIDEATRDYLFFALDRDVVRRMVLADNEWGANSTYMEEIEAGLDAVLGFYLGWRTCNFHVNNQGEGPPERYGGEVPAEGGSSPRLADRAGRERESQSSVDQGTFGHRR